MLATPISVPGFDPNEQPGQISFWKQLQARRSESQRKLQELHEKYDKKNSGEDNDSVEKQSLIISELDELPVELLEGCRFSVQTFIS